MRRRTRVLLAWCAAGPAVRLAILLIALVVLGLAAGCAAARPARCSYSIGVIQRDANSCAAAAHSLPACIAGLWVRGACPI